MAVVRRKEVPAPTAAPHHGGGRSPRLRRLTEAQRRWLRCGIDQPGGKLPLFDAEGRQISERTVQSCIDNGWAEPWFENPIRPGWLVCKLTTAGLEVAGGPL